MGTKKSRFARGVDDGFHVVQVALERLAAGGGQAVLGLGHPALEVPLAGDVAGFVKLAGMYAAVAVGRLQEILEVVEAQVLVDSQGADDAQAHPFVDKAFEVERRTRDPLGIRQAPESSFVVSMR